MIGRRIYLALEPGQWTGDGPAGPLRIQVIAITSGERPGWKTVSGWRCLPDDPVRRFTRVQVRTDALPRR